MYNLDVKLSLVDDTYRYTVIDNNFGFHEPNKKEYKSRYLTISSELTGFHKVYERDYYSFNEYNFDTDYQVNSDIIDDTIKLTWREFDPIDKKRKRKHKIFNLHLELNKETDLHLEQELEMVS